MGVLAGVVVVLLSSSPAVVAIPRTRVPAGSEALGTSLAQLVARHVSQVSREGTRVISSDDLDMLLGRERQRELLGCNEENACMAEIAAAMNADEVVASSASRLSSTITGQQWVVEVKRVDGRTGARRGSGVISVCGTGEAPLEVIGLALREAYGEKIVRPTNERCAPPAGIVTLAAGAVLAIGGGVALTSSLITRSAWETQQLPGNPVTVSRADAELAQGLFIGGLVSAGVGAGLVITSALLLSAKPPLQTAFVPLPSGGLVAFGGSF